MVINKLYVWLTWIIFHWDIINSNTFIIRFTYFIFNNSTNNHTHIFVYVKYTKFRNKWNLRVKIIVGLHKTYLLVRNNFLLWKKFSQPRTHLSRLVLRSNWHFSWVLHVTPAHTTAPPETNMRIFEVVHRL